MRFPEPGELFAQRYRIDKLLGSGGFSRVYRATQTDLERHVALKILRPPVSELQTDAERQRKLESLSQRFIREAKMVSRLRSAHTITMFDYGRDDSGMLFMVIEYVDGQDLTNLIRAEGAIAPERVFKILRQVLISLHEAHTLGMLHRDIKPQNIMTFEHLGEPDQVKLLDFGIVKLIDQESKADTRDLTDDGTLIGTPRYMSPEYIRGHDVGPASDIYSLGLVVYELLVGAQAVTADSSIQIIGRQLEPQSFFLPQHIPVSAPFRAIIDKMLHKELRHRYATCEAILQDIRAMETAQASPRALPADLIDVVSLEALSEEPALTAGARPLVTTPHPHQRTTTQERDLTAYTGSAKLASPPNNNKRVLIVAGSAILLIGLVIGALLILAGEEPPIAIADAGAPQQPTLSAPTPPPETPPAAPPAPKQFLVDSSPSGATIVINDKPVGVAPVSLSEPEIAFPARVTAQLGARSAHATLSGPRDLQITLPASPPQPVPTPAPTPEPVVKRTPTTREPRVNVSKKDPKPEPTKLPSPATLDAPLTPKKPPERINIDDL